MSLETFIGFSVAAILLALAPGPDNLFVLTQSVLYGPRAGLWVTLGLCSGLVVHTLAVSLGVAAVVQIPAAFLALKIIGALYLLYIAWRTIIVGRQSMAALKSPALTAGALYRRGIMMNITNPKVTVFFLAFLPQFIELDATHPSLQLLQLAVLFMAITLFVFGGIACLSGALGPWLQSRPQLWGKLNYVVAVILVGLALRLAFVQ